MPNSDLWPQIHSERKALAADLDGLDERAWSTPSLCSGWTVRDVVAHMTATAKISPASFFPKLLGSGFSLRRMQDKDIAAERGSSPADTLARFKDRVDSTSRPPGPADTMRGEVLVHSEDIRRPLGIVHTYPADMVQRVAEFFTGTNLILHSKSRIQGLTLRASDADWSYGNGPEVVGPLMSLVLAMTGRKAALSDLSGSGVATLQTRP